MATIKGKWKWNQIIKGPDIWLDSLIDFHSNNEDFVRLRIESYFVPPHRDVYYDDKQVTTHYMNDPNDENNDFDYEVICEFDEKYRVMDFGETEQEISEELYEFILANASEVNPIAEKLVEVANNVPKVFEAGKAQGRGEGYDSGYDAGLEAGKELGGYNEGYDAGKKTEHDTFWDAFQNVTRRNWNSAFSDKSWNDITFYPKQNIAPVGAAASIFRYADITDLEARLNECGVCLDTSEITSLNCAFGESSLTAMPAIDIRKCTDSIATVGMFSGCRSLKSIRKIIVNEAIMFPSSFQNCPMLENIAFEGVIGQNIDFTSCTKLTRESIESIVNALTDEPDVAHGKTLRFSKTAVDNAFRGGYVWNEELGTSVWDDAAPGSEASQWTSCIVSKLSTGWTITLV